METEAYTQWIKLFDDNISKSYKHERKELQSASMLLTALQTELKNVHQVLQFELTHLKRQLQDKDDLEVKVASSFDFLPHAKNDPPQLETKFEQPELKTTMLLDRSDLEESPDIFRNNSFKKRSLNSTTIDLSISEEDITNIEDSPTLFSKRKKSIPRVKKDKPEKAKKNIFKVIDKENSVVFDSTPELRVKKSKSRKAGNSKTGIWSSKKKRNSTITQLFTVISSNEQEPEIDQVDHNETFKEWIKDENETEMGVTKLLSFINKDNTINQSIEGDQHQNTDEMDSTQEVDEFSKALLFDDSPGVELSPKKKPKVASFVEPVVRGNARKLLKGFSCGQCRDFYGGMHLSPEELQKKLDACSKHRYKYRPPEDTLTGIWDLTIPEENRGKK